MPPAAALLTAVLTRGQCWNSRSGLCRRRGKGKDPRRVSECGVRGMKRLRQQTLKTQPGKRDPGGEGLSAVKCKLHSVELLGEKVKFFIFAELLEN